MTRWAGPRYVTVVATVLVPPGVDLSLTADRVRATLEDDLGLRLVGCDWRPDPDTIADAIGADYGQVGIVDLNPARGCKFCGAPADSTEHRAGCPDA